MIAWLSARALRAAAVAASGIGTVRGLGVEGCLEALRRLGSVQIDTINVVERAHHHVLRTRVADYRSEHLPELEAEPRRAIEYWSHAAAYIPIEGYRYCLPRMRRIRASGHEWFRAEPAAIAYVRDRIAAEGPLRAQDFDGPCKGKRGWWDWKPTKTALEYLFHSGELVSIKRRGFQKTYDLAERAIPSYVGMTIPTIEEMASYYVDLAVSSLGVFAAEDVAYMRKDFLEGIPAELKARVEAGRLIEVLPIGSPEEGAGSAKNRYFASPEYLDTDSRELEEARVFVLSPFDPLIIDRKRTSRLFGREYRLECYLPKDKREFGYFALPLLYHGHEGDAEIVGYLDAKAERGRSALVAQRLSLEPQAGARGCSAVARAAAAAIWDFAEFNGARSLELRDFSSSDGRMERSFRAAIAKAALKAGT